VENLFVCLIHPFCDYIYPQNTYISKNVQHVLLFNNIYVFCHHTFSSDYSIFCEEHSCKAANSLFILFTLFSTFLMAYKLKQLKKQRWEF